MSSTRLTFRSACQDVAWQKQLRDRHLAEGAPPVPHLDLGRAVVRPVSWRFAEHIILKYEWLGRMSNTTAWCYGIFFGSYSAGVCCVDKVVGACPVAHEQFGLERRELVYLARGACVHWAPKGTNSKLIAWTCRLVARDSGAKLIIAFADTDAGEYGTVYQAAGWTCVGRGASTRQWVAPDGTIRDQKHPKNLADAHGGTHASWAERLIEAGWRQQQSNPKWKYVQILDKSDKALAQRVERMRQPYPKRAGSVGSDTPTDQVGEGGAVPTSALQFHAK